MQRGVYPSPGHCIPQSIDDLLSKMEAGTVNEPAQTTGLHELCIAIKARMDVAIEQKDRLLYTALYSDCLSEILRRARRATTTTRSRQ